MNVRCPSCQTAFRIDPDKIPAAGVKARCSKCGATFQLNRAGGTDAGAGGSSGRGAGAVAGPAAAVRTAAPPPSAGAPVAAPAAAAPVAAPSPAPVPAARPSAPPEAAPIAAATRPAPVTQPASTATAGVKRPSFRNQDPAARAQRIARALVSDIVAYNKGKLKDPLDGARLRSEFRDEIRKSWEEYVEQVGLEMARSTPYFRDSLNEILARGQKVF